MQNIYIQQANFPWQANGLYLFLGNYDLQSGIPSYKNGMGYVVIKDNGLDVLAQETKTKYKITYKFKYSIKDVTKQNFYSWKSITGEKTIEYSSSSFYSSSSEIIKNIEAKPFKIFHDRILNAPQTYPSRVMVTGITDIDLNEIYNFIGITNDNPCYQSSSGNLLIYYSSFYPYATDERYYVIKITKYYGAIPQWTAKYSTTELNLFNTPLWIPLLDNTSGENKTVQILVDPASSSSYSSDSSRSSLSSKSTRSSASSQTESSQSLSSASFSSASQSSISNSSISNSSESHSSQSHSSQTDSNSNSSSYSSQSDSSRSDSSASNNSASFSSASQSSISNSSQSQSSMSHSSLSSESSQSNSSYSSTYSSSSSSTLSSSSSSSMSSKTSVSSYSSSDSSSSTSVSISDDPSSDSSVILSHSSRSSNTSSSSISSSSIIYSRSTASTVSSVSSNSSSSSSSTSSTSSVVFSRSSNSSSSSSVFKVSNDTVSLVRFEGTDGAKTATDEANTGSSFSFTAGASIATGNKKFGVSSGYMSGSYDGIYTTLTDQMLMGSDNFTLEFFAYRSGVRHYGLICLGDSTDSCILYYDNLYINYSDASSTTLAFGGYNASGFSHYAIVRNGTTISSYKDGALVQSASCGTKSLKVPSVRQLRFGWQGGGYEGIIGYIDSFRLVKNRALYTGAVYTVPTQDFSINDFLIENSSDSSSSTLSSNSSSSSSSTSSIIYSRSSRSSVSIIPDSSSSSSSTSSSSSSGDEHITATDNTIGLLHLNSSLSDDAGIYTWNTSPAIGTYDTNIKLLLHFDTTGFVDSSSYNRTPTIGSTASLSGSAPTGMLNAIKGTGASTDFISFADSDDWNISASDASIDFFVYITSYGPGAQFMGQYVSGSEWLLYGNTAGAVAVGVVGTNELITSNGVLSLNTWHHIAITRTNSTSTVKIFVDGVEKASGTGAYFNNSATAFSICKTNMYGYISELRWSKGVNQFSGGVVVPTAPYTPYISAYNTSVKKFGTASISFNGTATTVNCPSLNTAAFVANPFTIDFWFYIPTSANAGSEWLISTRILDASYTGIVLAYVTTDNKLVYYSSSNGSSWNLASNIRSTNVISRDTWHHLAYVWSGAAYVCYIDGVAEFTVTTTTSIMTPIYGLFIGGNGVDEGLHGYIDEIRVCNSTMYTGAFTPNTLPYQIDPVTANSAVDIYTKALIHMNGDQSDHSYYWKDFSGASSSGYIGSFSSASPRFTGNYYGTFNGSSNYLRNTPVDTDFNINATTWTIDFCANIKQVSTNWAIACAGGANTNDFWHVSNSWNTPTDIYFAMRANGNSWVTTVVSSAGALSTGWHHIAICKNGSTINIYVDGVSVANSNSFTANNNIGNYLFIGNALSTSGAVYSDADMCEYRFSSIARYSGNFTPNTIPYTHSPISGYIYDQAIKLLTHFDSTSFLDYSLNRYSPTIGSTASLSETAPTGMSNALKCTGSVNDQIYFADSSDWDLSASDGSIDFFIYPTTLDVDGALLCGQSNAGGDNNWYLYTYQSGAIGIGRAGLNELATAAGAVAINGWYHVAVTRTNSTSTTKIFINGVEKASGTTAWAHNASTSLYIGASGQGKFKGYISEFRWSKGANQYPNNLVTTPTVPYGNITYIPPENSSSSSSSNSSSTSSQTSSSSSSSDSGFVLGYLTDAHTGASSATGTASASSEFTDGTGTTYAWEAFDQTGGNAPYAGWSKTTADPFPCWLKYQFTSPQRVNKYTILRYYSGSDFAPKAWTFQASNNNTDWTTLDTITNQTGWSTTVEREFTFSNFTKYTYYRILISEANNTPYGGISELRLYSI